MSKYYRGLRKRNLYQPGSDTPFKLSRSRIDLYVQCPRCFYIDRRLGLDRPPGYPFNLNNAVDTLLKSEFDKCRNDGQQHPIQEEYSLKLRPAPHAELDTWRNNFKGVQYLHEEFNLLIFGAIDDLWIDEEETYAVVDYKATAKKGRITELDQGWHAAYKRQMEIYQWLVRRNGLNVSDTGYFVYCNGQAELPNFENTIQFDTTLIAYEGSDHWVEQKIADIHKCLNSDEIPSSNYNCDFCKYTSEIEKLIN